MKTIVWSIIISTLFATGTGFAQTDIFNPLPEWESEPLNHYATGLGIADINQDGWDDIVAANGNDMARQSVSVYYNAGNGEFPREPSWNSSDIDYHGHLAVGDVNGDGVPDVAVSVFLGPGRFNEPGYVKVYFNQGNELESTPSYQTADSMFTFSCALGDADGDGDLDLAVAGGQPYNAGVGPYQTCGRIYYNDGDSLQTVPGWQSQVSMGAMDVDFADMDGNGCLDLIFACHRTPNYIFLADDNCQISTQPSWISQDNDYHANSLTIARIDSNNFLDLIVSDNDQLGGQGKYKAYIFDTTQTGESSPTWHSQTGGYGSAVLAEDLDIDGYIDLLAGRWWGRVQLYPGIRNGLSASSDWTSSISSVIEAFALRDIDHDNRFTMIDSTIIQRDSIHVIYVSETHVETINTVELNGLLLMPGVDYCTVPGAHWISIKPVLRAGDRLLVEYDASHDRDLVVTNWGPQEGNFLFYNQLNPNVVTLDRGGEIERDVSVFPNPFNDECVFHVEIPTPSPLWLNIFDVAGRFVSTVVRSASSPGTHELRWDGKNERGSSVASGVYFYRLDVGGKRFSGKLVVIR